jgi:glycosyltransferase involved in cell wall biosynthesis
MAVPDVSVIVTVYNTRPYLSRCLRSVLRQTIGLDRIQVVAVDDGSTDGSGRVLTASRAALAAADPGGANAARSASVA